MIRDEGEGAGQGREKDGRDGNGEEGMR